MSFWTRLFGVSKHPERHAEQTYAPYAQQQRDVLEQYFTPFLERGKQAGASYGDISQQMATDPTSYYQKLMEGYQQSPQYEQKMADMMKRARSAAAAGGMVGTETDRESQMKLANALLDEDMQGWLKNIMGIQGQGMQGESDLYRTGFQAASQMAPDIASTYGGQASAAVKGGRDDQARRNALMQSIFGGLGTIAGYKWGK